MTTVISWCNEAYRFLAEGLAADCRRWGYGFHLYNIEREYKSLIHAWCNHPKIIRQGVLDFDEVLFLDVECRIVRPLPDHWQAPLVSVRKPSQPFWITYNTGTVMANRTCLPWLDAWIRTIDRWDMANMADDAYIRWPNDICDELAFHGAIAALDVQLQTVDLEYENRDSDAEIARGLWCGKNTVVQHPTLHHWPKVTDALECKKLFYQNFAGRPEAIEPLFASHQGRVHRDGWWFDTKEQTYAPEMFADQVRPWSPKPVNITASQR